MAAIIIIDGVENCKRCGVPTPVYEFHRSWHICKACHAAYDHAYHEKMRDRKRITHRKWKQDNKHKVREQYRRYVSRHRALVRLHSLRWHAKHKEQAAIAHSVWAIKNRVQRLAYSKRWRKLNGEKAKATTRRSYIKRAANSSYRLSRSIRVGMWAALRGNKRGRSWESLVGYSRAQLKRHLEHLFLSGMSWENVGKWHIDHIIPVSFFVFNSVADQEFIYCWSLANLRPLWGADNIRKHDKLTGEQPACIDACGVAIYEPAN